MSVQNKKSENDEMKLSSVFYKYMPYWPLLIIFLMLTSGAAYAYLLFTNPKYEAKASIILKDEKKDDRAKQPLNLDPLQSKNIIENEIEVLKSRSLMDSVVKALHLYATVTSKDKYKSSVLYNKAPVVIISENPNGINDVKNVPFSVNAEQNTVSIDNKPYPVDQWVSTPYGRLQFRRNGKQFKTHPALHLSLRTPKSVAGSYLGSLKVSVATKVAGVVNFTLADEVPKRAEDIINKLIHVYTQAIVQDKNAEAANTLSFVEERLGSVSRELDSIERNIQKYKSGTNAIDISTQGRLFLQNVSANDQKLSEINMKLAVLKQVEDYVSARNSAGNIVPATLGVDDPVLSQLLDKLYTSELEYEKLKRTVGENNAVLVQVTDQMEKIKPNILDNIRSQKQSLLATRSNLAGTNSSYNNLLQTLPQKEQQLLEKSREQSIKSNIYSFLLQKREESAIAGANNFSDVRIIDKAQASKTPVSPNKGMVYGISLVTAFIFLFGVVGIREGFNLKIMFRKEIETLTTLPVVGEIGQEKNPEPIVVHRGKRTFVSEEFRRIRVTLPYLGVGANKKKILVTSSIPGEGKSFIALNLAQTLALANKKVVLIEMDLNNPSLSKSLDLVNEKSLDLASEVGVTQVLAGEADTYKVIVKTTFNENLYFMPAGTLPANPSELLSDSNLTQFFATLEESFDYLVIDTAPIVPVSDAFLISQYCDATLFVVRHKYTPKMFLERLDESLKLNPLTNPAIVFNGVLKRGITKSSYGYGYSYNYMTDYLSDTKK